MRSIDLDSAGRFCPDPDWHLEGELNLHCSSLLVKHDSCGFFDGDRSRRGLCGVLSKWLLLRLTPVGLKRCAMQLALDEPIGPVNCDAALVEPPNSHRSEILMFVDELDLVQLSA